MDKSIFKDMKKIVVVAFSICLAGGAFAQTKAYSKADYLKYCEVVAMHYINDLDGFQKKWRENMRDNGRNEYLPGNADIYLAALCANLFELTGKKEYLDATKELLLEYGEYKGLYADHQNLKPEYKAGLPAIPNFFTVPKYAHAYAILKKNAELSKKETETIETNLEEGANYILTTQEWGTMNRAMLKAEGLAYAALDMPNNSHSKKWSAMAKAIESDNLGKWSIEDASSYAFIWLYSMVGYVSDVKKDDELIRTPMMNYYLQYYLSLLSPAGDIPDFGDSYWAGSWFRAIPVFEKGASLYKDPKLRWAAAKMIEENLDTGRMNITFAMMLSDACRWADFSIGVEQPKTKSQEVLDDIVGKKVVFRNGWDKNSTYMLLNYRDEGDGGWLYRENLRTTLTVEEEKMHHGHADENSIPLLMKNASVLLHDGGYRGLLPSGPMGAYRADYFHNRVVVRKDKISLGQKAGQQKYNTLEAVPAQSVLDFFQNSGAYRNVRTQKIDFVSLDHFDMSRTRIIDEKIAYEADRIVNYVKDLDCFVIFDVVRFTEDDYLSMANLWHTRKVVAQGDNWYDTEYDSLRNISVAGDERLLIYFPYTRMLESGVADENRYWQNEKMIYQVIGRHGYPNDLQVFVTVLFPHGKDQKPEELIKKVEMIDLGSSFPRAVALKINDGTNSYIIAAKLDLRSDYTRDWTRPKYTWDSGKITYGNYETDGSNLFIVEKADKVHYATVCATRMKYNGKVLYEQAEVGIEFNMDGSPHTSGVWQFRYWQDEVEK